jgi:hypothetical protein
MKPSGSIAGCLGRALGCVAALALGSLGLVFLVAASVRHPVLRAAAGATMVLAAVGIGLVVMQAHLRVRDRDVTPGPRRPAIREARCPGCGRSLEDQRVHMQGADAIITCPACGATYRLEEEPRW